MPEVGPEDGLVVRGVDVLVFVLNVADPDPVALGGAGHVAVHQLVHFLPRHHQRGAECQSYIKFSYQHNLETHTTALNKLEEWIANE